MIERYCNNHRFNLALIKIIAFIFFCCGCLVVAGQNPKPKKNKRPKPGFQQSDNFQRRAPVPNAKTKPLFRTDLSRNQAVYPSKAPKPLVRTDFDRLERIPNPPAKPLFRTDLKPVTANSAFTQSNVVKLDLYRYRHHWQGYGGKTRAMVKLDFTPSAGQYRTPPPKPLFRMDLDRANNYLHPPNRPIVKLDYDPLKEIGHQDLIMGIVSLDLWSRYQRSARNYRVPCVPEMLPPNMLERFAMQVKIYNTDTKKFCELNDVQSSVGRGEMVETKSYGQGIVVDFQLKKKKYRFYKEVNPKTGKKRKITKKKEGIYRIILHVPKDTSKAALKPGQPIKYKRIKLKPAESKDLMLKMIMKKHRYDWLRIMYPEERHNLSALDMLYNPPPKPIQPANPPNEKPTLDTPDEPEPNPATEPDLIKED